MLKNEFEFFCVAGIWATISWLPSASGRYGASLRYAICKFSIQWLNLLIINWIELNAIVLIDNIWTGLATLQASGQQPAELHRRGGAALEQGTGNSDAEWEQSDNAGTRRSGTADATAGGPPVGEPMAVRLSRHVVGSLPATSRAHRLHAGGQWLRPALPRPFRFTQQAIGWSQRRWIQMLK